MKRILQLLFCLSFLTPMLAGAATSAGSFDPLFGTDGRVVFDYGNNYDYGKSVLIQPDGKYILIGYGSTVEANIGIGFVGRHNRDGSFDTSFNGTGRRVFGDESIGASVSGGALQPDGKLLVVGYVLIPEGGGVGSLTARLWRLNGDGSFDAGFGNGGAVSASATTLPWLFFQGVAVQPDGAIVVVGREYGPMGGGYRSAIYRYLANGQPDLSFGNGGRVAIDTLAPNLSTLKFRRQADGKLLLAGYSLTGGTELAMVVRLNPDGSPDGSFATGGVFTLPLAGYGTEFDDFHIGANGEITLAGFGYAPSSNVGFVVRLDSAGVPLASFGQQGLLTLPAVVALATGVLVQTDGKIVVTGAKRVNDDYQGLILRLHPDGTLDQTFGAAGINQDFGYSRSYGQGVALDADGKILIAGIAHPVRDDSMLARIIGDEVTTPVIEFFNVLLDHYFITANPIEAAAIDGGSAGPGWSRTLLIFKSGGPNRVCRFYGNPDINPATGMRRGPNSHVYSMDPDECAQIRQDIGWRFESYDFNGWPKTGITACPPGTIAVYRVYNGRFMFNDSNHRYTISLEVYNQMIAIGWIGEGVVFCAPL